MDFKNAVPVKIDINRWVNHIKDGLKEEEEETMEFSICVFNVPKQLLAAKPEAYIPQCVSIGPYHHWRPELYEMERYKVHAARRFQKRIIWVEVDRRFESVVEEVMKKTIVSGGQRFETVVEEVMKYEWEIRNHYHKYLDYSKDALAWLMALDACFVLECLQFYVKHADEASSEVKQLGKVLDPSGRSASHNEIMRDLMMLENQMPLFLLEKLLEMQLGSQEAAEERLGKLIRLVCKELSPFMFEMKEISRLRIKDRGHILETLYFSLVPADAGAAAMDYPNAKAEENQEASPPDTARLTRAFNGLWKVLSSVNVGPVRRITAVPRRVLGPLTVLFKTATAAETTVKDVDGKSSAESPPTRDELGIASVSKLSSAGVKFVPLPTEGDLTKIRFDRKTATLYLPKVKLEANTEVILRNLVAYEAAANPGAFFFTRYTDFMNGMIDSEIDVRLLIKSKIICNYLGSDEMAASMWNGMGKCVKLTKVEQLDRVITEVKTYYNRRWSVAVVELIKTYIFGSWKFLSLFAAVILLCVTCLQAFCSVYNCNRWFDDTSFLED